MYLKNVLLFYERRISLSHSIATEHTRASEGWSVPPCPAPELSGFTSASRSTAGPAPLHPSLLWRSFNSSTCPLHDINTHNVLKGWMLTPSKLRETQPNSTMSFKKKIKLCPTWKCFFLSEVFPPALYTYMSIFNFKLITDNLQRDLNHHPSTPY